MNRKKIQRNKKIRELKDIIKSIREDSKTMDKVRKLILADVSVNNIHLEH